MYDVGQELHNASLTHLQGNRQAALIEQQVRITDSEVVQIALIGKHQAIRIVLVEAKIGHGGKREVDHIAAINIKADEGEVAGSALFADVGADEHAWALQADEHMITYRYIGLDALGALGLFYDVGHGNLLMVLVKKMVIVDFLIIDFQGLGHELAGVPTQSVFISESESASAKYLLTASR